jgi:O-antigen ligase
MEGQYIKVNNIKTQWAAVENAFLTYLVSGGLLGLSIFLLLFIMFWGMMLFARNNSPDDPFIRFHAEAFLLGIVGIAVANMFAAWLIFAIPMWTMFMGFLGMGACLYNMYREESPGLSRASSRPTTLPRVSGAGAGPADAGRVKNK